MEDNSKMAISGLYYRYGKVSDEKLRDYLTRYKIVVEKNNGVGSVHGYYSLADSAIAVISDKLRKVGFNMDEETMKTEDQPIEGLTEWKTIKYLVKSTSRFTLKVDIGEIFDQIHWEDLFYKNTFKAILFSSENYMELPDTQGEHFVLTVKLLN
jgi:hypothetical protein